MNDADNNVLIVVVVERGKADVIVEAARSAGASGATVFFARGSGTEEHLSFFKVQVDAMKEVVLLLVRQSQLRTIVGAITSASRLTEPGTGILFTVPVGLILGLEYRQADQVDT